jgi:hypothetical protein
MKTVVLTPSLVVAIFGCRDSSSSASKPLTNVAPIAAPSTNGGALSDTAQLANTTWSNKTCIPNAAAGQRVGKASVSLHGDGVDISSDVQAICGGLYTEATHRFAVADGTLFRACFDDGSVMQVSADVQLAGTVNTEFRYENYKNVGPLIEFFRHDVGTYNQREGSQAARAGETIEEHPTLQIDQDWKTVDLKISLQWPAYKQVGPQRIINATVHWDCGNDMTKPSK